ncbi:MAG: pyridoxamine 5'-phosphate oxidase family protein [Pseudomonadota bacterium]
MSKTYDRLEQKHKDFIASQKMFFVATAPLSEEGRVNLSPKGYDSLRIIDDETVEWLDLGGSGIETLAHIRENGRITLMFCAFEGAANILRVYGRGEAIHIDEPGFDEALAAFPKFERARSIVRIHVDRLMDSCGWGVPFYEFKGERDQLERSTNHKPLDEWKAKRYASNAQSIDGLTGLVAPDARPEG